jgi:hypothetical protein
LTAGTALQVAFNDFPSGKVKGLSVGLLMHGYLHAG